LTPCADDAASLCEGLRVRVLRTYSSYDDTIGVRVV
jgi:hypothetical protein